MTSVTNTVLDDTARAIIINYLNNMGIDTNLDPNQGYYKASQILLSSSDSDSYSKKILTQAKKLLTPANLPEFWQQVILLNDVALMTYCKDHVTKNFKAVELKNLNEAQMIIITQSTISNVDKLDMVVKWINATMPVQNNTIELLFNNINFSCLTCKTMFKYMSMLNAVYYDFCLPFIKTQCTKEPECNVAIGIYGKTYEGYCVVNRADLNENFRVKLNTDLKNFSGVLALDDIRLNDDDETVIRTDDCNINFNRGLCVLNKEINKGQICNIYNCTKSNNFLSVDKIESDYIGGVKPDEIYAFFVRT